MTMLFWDNAGERLYETGIDRGVLYPKTGQFGAYGTGVAWNGLTSVNENPSGAEETALYANNYKYLSMYSNEDFAATIEAYTYPDEWAQCDGSAEVADGVLIGQQERLSFGMAYRTILGNDALHNKYGYKLHLLYGGTASPSSKSFSTVNDSPDAITFSWEVKTVPEKFNDEDHLSYKPTSIIVIDSTKCDAEALAALEAILYGSAGTEPRLPLPDEVIDIMGGESGESGVSAGN